MPYSFNPEETLTVHIAVCLGCGSFGDAQYMPEGFHGRCFIKKFGMAAFKALPPELLKGLQIDAETDPNI